MNLIHSRAAWFLASALLCAPACNSVPEASVPNAQPVVGKQYYVIGAVAMEGGQEFNGDVTIFEAVTKAEPRKDSADLGRVRLIRADPHNPFEVIVDLQRMIETGDSTNNVHVQERDVIYVPTVEPKR
jgi:protein involved in polysaccharide export with SLBB domain